MTLAVFIEKAPTFMTLLMQDFGFDELDAAAIMGNLGHESGGLTNFQEDNPTSGRGGWGWAQWTGPRRVAFEQYCARNDLDPKSDKANYGWLFVELKGSESKAIDRTKAAVGLEAKVEAFERSYERAGVKNYPSRVKWAQRALDAYHAANKPDNDEPPIDLDPEDEAPPPFEAKFGELIQKFMEEHGLDEVAVVFRRKE